MEVEVEVAVMAVAAVAVAARHLQGSERVQRRAQEAVPLSEREGMLDRDRWRRRARAAFAAATADAGRDGAAARPALLAWRGRRSGMRAVRLRVCEAPYVPSYRRSSPSESPAASSSGPPRSAAPVERGWATR